MNPLLNFTHFTTISGISGASGIYYEKDNLYLISDDSYVLYRYTISTQLLQAINLNPDKALEAQITKKLKPDFEAFTKQGNSFFIFGSGSAQNRFNMRKVNADFSRIENFSLQNLYNEMMQFSSVAQEDFNIEGIILSGETAYFFNRGNGPNKKNGIISVENWQGTEPHKISFIPIDLPKINGGISDFTDAILDNDTIYFTASSEDTISTYDDGAVLGSGIGKISFPNFELQDFKIISNKFKIEGLTIFEKSETGISFLLCEDSDSDNSETQIFRYDWK